MSATTADTSRDVASIVRAVAADDLRTSIGLLDTMDREETFRAVNVLAFLVAAGAAGRAEEVREFLAASGFDLETE